MRIPIVDADGAAAWPELFPPTKIDDLRQTVGPRHFSAQMMLEYISDERARLDANALRFYAGELDLRTARLVCINNSHDVGSVASPPSWGGVASECEPRGGYDANLNDSPPSPASPVLPPKRGETRTHSDDHVTSQITGVAAYWDPSSARAGADSSVCALILRDDRARRAFIHDIKYLRINDADIHPMSTQCGMVLDFMETHGLRHIAIEVNGLGNAMPEILRDTAIRRGQALVVQRVINHEKKERRILDALEPLLGTGRLYAHERVRNSPLLDEMADWSPAAGAINRDDGLDAVAGALRLQPIPVRPRGSGVRPLTAKTEFGV
ncbi:MAG: hypothetical protein FWC61_04665 [Proteobacteria bacterium]|nr:hypothetical protein [Pseudomonadota bacterium]